MNLLLDTHVIIWTLTEPKRIPLRIQRMIAKGAGIVFVSHVSLWEIATKRPLGRRTALPLSASETMEGALRSGLELLPVDVSHILTFERMPRLHGDPVDRLLVAQARTEGLSLVTHDERLAAYGETVISW